MAEESKTCYRRGHFHPVHLGEVYNDKYKVLRKLGHGAYSTVWLVEDTPQCSYKAMKVLSAACYGAERDLFEVEILRHLQRAAAGSKHEGRQHVPVLLDSFEHDGPNGRHVCLVLELLAENLHVIRKLFADRKVPDPLVRSIAVQLLFALHYAHKLGVIHTDIKPQNILVKLKDHSAIGIHLEQTSDTAGDDKTEPWEIPSLCLHNEWGEKREGLLDLEVVLNDWGAANWTDRHRTETIQPIRLRAPEALIRAPWNTNVDIWNLGAVLFELREGTRLFDFVPDGRKKYGILDHIEETVKMFGPIPPALRARGRKELVGAVFDAKGLPKGLPPWDCADPHHPLVGFTGSDIGLITLIEAMLVVDPAVRPSAAKLLENKVEVSRAIREGLREPLDAYSNAVAEDLACAQHTIVLNTICHP